MTKDSGERFEQLTSMLQKLDLPIMEMADQLAEIHDKLNGELWVHLCTFRLMLIYFQNKRGEMYFAGCPRSIIRAITTICQRIYYRNLANGF